MFASSDRRDFLRICTAGAAGLCVSFSVRGQTENVALQATKLGNNLVLISGAGANVIAVAGPDGLAMVDGGLPEHSAELVRLVAAQGESHPVKVLFNTNWHLAHTGSNETLGKAGAKIVAHANTTQMAEDLGVSSRCRTEPTLPGLRKRFPPRRFTPPPK